MSRVFHVTKSHAGGGGIYALRLSAALRDAGIESRVLALDDGRLGNRDGLMDRAEKLADRLIAGCYHRRSRAPFHSFLRLREWKSEEPIDSSDIVHLHSITGFIGGRGLDGLLTTRPRVFWTAHNPWLFTGGCVAYDGCDEFIRGCSQCPILKAPLGRMAGLELRIKRRWIERHEVRAIANSEWMAAMMRQSPMFQDCSQISVVPPIVDEVFHHRLNRSAARMKLGIPEDRFVVGLSASSLTDPGKGIAEFFQGLPLRAEWLAKVTFLLIGDGVVEVPAGVKAQFTGRVAEPARLAALYGVCDFFVSASFMETYGMAIAEAQACGVPVLAFAAGGTPEAVFPGKPCRLVANRDFTALQGALEDAVSNGPATAEQREVLADWIRKRNGSKAIAERQMKIHESRAERGGLS